MMMMMRRKKSKAGVQHPTIPPVKQADTPTPIRKQLLHEISAKMNRKHSTQRAELARMKVNNILNSTVMDMESPSFTGFLDAPARTQPISELIKPIPLLKQGRLSSKKSSLTAKTMKKAMHVSHDTTRSNVVVGKTPQEYLPPMLSADAFGVCYGDHVPCTISVIPLDGFEDEEGSEISLEETLMQMSASTATDATDSQFTTGTTSTMDWPYGTHLASATKPCMPTSLDYLNSMESSLSWPSDEEDASDEDNESVGSDGKNTNHLSEAEKTSNRKTQEPVVEEVREEVEIVVKETHGVAFSPDQQPPLQLITAIKDLSCYDDGSSHYMNPDMASLSASKFWSVGRVNLNNLHISGREEEGFEAARDEEEQYRDGGNGSVSEERTSTMADF